MYIVQSVYRTLVHTEHEVLTLLRYTLVPTYAVHMHDVLCSNLNPVHSP